VKGNIAYLKQSGGGAAGGAAVGGAATSQTAGKVTSKPRVSDGGSRYCQPLVRGGTMSQQGVGERWLRGGQCSHWHERKKEIGAKGKKSEQDEEKGKKKWT
jgi:hypothetical protein